MALHEVQLKGYSVRPGNLSLGTFDSYGIEQLHVTADDSWDGLDILAVFHAPDGTATKVVVGADGMLTVPPEATAKQAGVGRIVFVGLAENVQRITVDMGYNIKPHSDIEGDNPGTPTPDVVQQILENSNHAVSIATAAQDAAENARQAAEDAAQKAGDGAGGAAASAAAAKKSAKDAAASSESAADKAEASESSANAAHESAKAAQTAQGSAENAAQTADDAAGVARQAADAAVQGAEAAKTAKQRAEDAAKKALEAKTGSENALQDAGAARDAASGYADAAAESAAAAAASEKNAAKSANSAADSAAAAKKSAEDADNTANSIKDSMAQISENKEAVSQLKEDLSDFKNNVDKNMSSFNKFDDFNESVGLVRIDSGIAYIDSSFNRYKTITINAVSGQEFEFIGSVNGAIHYLVVTTDASGKVIEKYNQGVNGVVSQKTQVISVDDNIKKIYFCFWQNSGYSLRKKDLVNINDFENQIKSYTDTKYAEAITYVDNVKEDTAALKKRQNVLVGSETGNPVSCNDAYSAPLCGLTVYGKSTQDGTPSPDNPVPIVSAGDDGSIAVKVTGTNMVEGTKLGNRGNVSGVSYTANKDGISFVGKADTSLNIYLHNDIKEKLTPGVYYLTTKGLSASVSINFYQVGSFNNDVQNKEVRIVAGKEYTILLRIEKGTAVNALVVQASLARSKITTYSPYREQLLTLPTPHGLPGIPVTSGGNYTDQNGQQWICDEVDLERGVKVQRVDKLAFDNTKTLAEQNAILATPVETPLTPAEIAAYKAITAYAPDTVVQASDGAGIKLDYQRDVNLVVKNLEDAIASMTTT